MKPFHSCCKETLHLCRCNKRSPKRMKTLRSAYPETRMSNYLHCVACPVGSSSSHRETISFTHMFGHAPCRLDMPCQLWMNNHRPINIFAQHGKASCETLKRHRALHMASGSSPWRWRTVTFKVNLPVGGQRWINVYKPNSTMIYSTH